MIWIRRILTIPLIISFLIVFTLTLVVTQVNKTAGSAGFYNHQMEKSDVYDFVYDEVLPATLDEVEKNDTSDDIPVSLSPIKDDLASAARKILPPAWLKSQFESATRAIIPYLTGSADEFTYTLPFRSKVGTATAVIKQDILHGEAFDSIYNDLIAYAADKMLDNLDKLPYTLTISKDETENSLKDAFSKQWMAAQLDTAIDSVTPYLTNDSDHFTVTFNIRDRVDDIATAAVELISEEETYQYLLDQMVEPTIEENLSTTVNLPLEIALSREEITSAVEEVLPQSWVDAQLREVADDIVAYAKGEIDNIEVTVDLADRKEAAREVLTKLANDKLERLFNSLPSCTTAEFISSIEHLSQDELPDCRPAGISYTEFKSSLNIDVDATIAAGIDQMVLNQIPDQWIYNDEDLRQSLGEGNEGFLDDARDYVSDGWTFTEADLRDKLSSDGQQNIDDVRDWIGNGYTLTEADLRDRISNEDDLNSFDDARDWINTARTWLWALWLIPVIFLIAIGFLGGRNWKSRLMWALCVLFVCSLIICVAVAISYSHEAKSKTQDAIDTSKYDGIELVIARKGNEMIENAASDFASDIRDNALYTMIVSGAGIAGVIGWSVISNRRKNGMSSSSSDTDPNHG